MGRPRQLLPPAFRASMLCAAGILCADLLPDVSLPILCAACLSLTALLVFALRLVARCNAAGALLAAFVCVLLGVVKGMADLQARGQLPEQILDRLVQIRGTIVSMPEVSERKAHCLLRLFSVKLDSMVYPTDALVALTVTRRLSEELTAAYGMSFVAAARLSEPSDVRNPGEISPRERYRASGIQFLGVMRMHECVVIDSTGGSWLMRQLVVPVRRFVNGVISSSVGGREAAFLGGLLLGDRTGMPGETRDAFVAAGVAHVLAVSGSNVAVVAGALLLACQLLRIPRLARTVIVAAGVLLYMLVTGAQPSVVRASIMALVFLATSLAQVKSHPLNVVGVAGVIILAIDSQQLFDVGFQLSFAAVIAILVLYPPMDTMILRLGTGSLARRTVIWVLRLGAVSLAASIGTLPLTAANFGTVSIISALANIVVVPLTELSVLLGLFSVGGAIIHPWIGSIYGEVNRLLLGWTLGIVEFAGGLPFAAADTASFETVDALPYFAAVAFFFHFRLRAPGRGAVLFCAAAAVAVCWPRGDLPARRPGILRVTFIDVGQGDAILAELPDGQTILVDAGPATPEFDAGARIIGPYLRRSGITEIDLLLITHPHQDHVGGVPYLMKHFTVRRTLDGSSDEGVSAALSPHVPEHVEQPVLLLGEDLDVRLYCFPSFQNARAPGPGTRGNSSLVMKLQYGDVSFLLSGDAETDQEQALLAAYGNFLRATVLKAGHHGSNTSSSEQFLALVRPSVCVVSVGARNSFGHPSGEVLDRLSAMGIPVARTDREGAVIFETDGRTFSRIDWR